MILLRRVSVTREPTATEPENSATAATAIACFIVREREETDVANEFATSFAPEFYMVSCMCTGSSIEVLQQVYFSTDRSDIPMFQASRKENMVVMAKI